MKKITLSLVMITIAVLIFGFVLSAFSQKPTMELTFTAEFNGQYVPLDSILIENLTQGGDTILYTPDTALVFDYATNIGNNQAVVENSSSVSQNYPNPFKGQTEVDLYLPEREYIKITVRDILGREVAQYENTLIRGNHSFAFYSGKEKYYLFTVTGKQTSKTIKMLNTESNTTYGGKCKIEYCEYADNVIGFKSQNAINSFVFELGDELRFTGYAMTVNEVIGSDEIVDVPQSNQLYEFEIIEGIGCPGTPSVTYEGMVYNTVLIGNQCWLKENLNVGTMIGGISNQTDNGTIEKYCYDNISTNCATYGGLYQWNEMMQYTTIQGVQGICPPDWHLPTDEEWKQLEGAVDSQYGYPDPEWDDTGWRGFDAGLNLKFLSGWNSSGNGTDEFGFTALPGGIHILNGYFTGLGSGGYFWSSTEYSTYNVWYRLLSYYYDEVGHYVSSKDSGFSTRCVQD